MPSPGPSTDARARPLRMRLLLLAATGLLPLIGVLGWGVNHLLEERRHEIERSVLELSRALATAVDGDLSSIATLLDQIGTSDDLERADLRGFQLAARRSVEQFGWEHVDLADADGRVLMRTNETVSETPPRPLDTDSMMRAIQTQRTAVSRVIRGPDRASEVFAVRVPVMRGGQLTYVLSAFVPAQRIAAVLARQNIPGETVVGVFDQQQYRVARSKEGPSPFVSPTLKLLLDQGLPYGVGRTVTIEGVDSYSGYTRLAGSGWVVAVGTSVEQANQGLYALLRAIALGMAASLGLAILLAWVLAKRVVEPIEALKRAAVALGRGAPVDLPPLDIVELDDVAQALREAALERDRAAGRVADALRSAEEANRSKDQFLAMLGHELRNPLAPIANAVQIMAVKGDETTAPERRIIERQLVHVARLVDDLLDVSRITSGRLAIRREPLRIGAVIRQVVDTVRLSIFQRTLTYDAGPGVDQAWVAGDETRLAQVFNNLLVNAIKFTPTGGEIHVRAAIAGHNIRVDVADSGIGMEPRELDRIFDLFYQAPQSPDRARGGLGLGLPIVRSLVAMHGGHVSAASAGPGQGSCLTVLLPLCDPPVITDDPSLVGTARGAGHVLVVDDNEDAADTCAALLELSGYTVRTAYTPEQALQLLGQLAPDVAILDIGLPGMSGYELAVKFKAAGYHGRLVALTGYGQAADVAASQQAGFDAHLTKPVAPSALLELVERLVKAKPRP